MADNLTPKQRSHCMSQVRSHANAATEGKLVRVLRENHIIGWRRHLKLFGNPDFVFLKHRLAVFVDGCFWHSCPKHSSRPATNRGFWKEKLNRNEDRDRLVTRTLRESGWRVLRIWQHELTRKNENRCAKRIINALQSLAQQRFRVRYEY